MAQTNLAALQAGIKLLADAAVDVIDKNTLVAGYANLLPDLMSLIPQMGELPAEVKSLQPADYDALLANLVADLNLPAGKTATVISASLKLLSDLATDVPALIDAIKA